MAENKRQDSEPLWKFAEARGISRRHFLRLMAVGGAAAVLAACAIPETPGATQPLPPPLADSLESVTPARFKDPSPFIVHDDKSLEARLENMRGLITPNRYFFVRNNSVSLDLDTGHLASVHRRRRRSQPAGTDLRRHTQPARPRSDVLPGVRRQSSRDVRHSAGTGRLRHSVEDRRSQQRRMGRRVPARRADAMAGVKDNATSVLLVGLDTESPEEGFRRVIPVEKAMHPDTLLAYTLNGEPLPRDHGFPVRALVPGWVGSTSIKWLGRIVVSSEQLWTRNNTTSYVLIGDDYPPEGEAQGKVAGMQTIKSALALPWPAELSLGLHRIHGYAHSPHGPIVRVEWSADGGAPGATPNCQAPSPNTPGPGSSSPGRPKRASAS